MKIMYIDMINSGISGDLFLGALLGLVDNPNKIVENLIQLKVNLSGVKKLKIKLVKEELNGIFVNKLDIGIEEKKHHRHVKDLKDALNTYLDDRNFTEDAKRYANEVLNSLIKAEAKVHDKLEENIHLHELSSVDTLIDILGVTHALEVLSFFDNNLRIYASKVPLGGGSVKAAHGILPVPAPATSKIIKDSRLIVYPGPIDQELTTPTGAALLVNLNPILNSPSMQIQKESYSTGQKKFENFPNILRIFYGTQHSDEEQKSYLFQYNQIVSIIETNIDDVSGELIGDFISLIEDDALDIHVIQSLTKKNRPGYIIKIICQPEKKLEIIDKTLKNLGTLGVRYHDIDRICVEREIRKKDIKIDGESHTIRYKASYVMKNDDKIIINVKPEYEDLKALRKKTHYSIKELQMMILPKLYEIYIKKDRK
ncbi:MAG: nickel pincer cofactor biosynthesis protein LarC [Candidatus Lokiarchaeota archaeon]|nr:nickel pincer cofactor biosynthesis protein LarC [Candidatus Lokiarchaeota archaeon]